MSQTTLKRSLNLPLFTLYGLGNILGAGIYVLVGKVAASSGIYLPIAFFVASIVAAITACTYAEMSSRYPHSAGEAVYLQQGFHLQWLSVLVGLLITTGGIVSAATLTRGFAAYFNVFLACGTGHGFINSNPGAGVDLGYHQGSGYSCPVDHPRGPGALHYHWCRCR